MLPRRESNVLVEKFHSISRFYQRGEAISQPYGVNCFRRILQNGQRAGFLTSLRLTSSGDFART